MSNAEKSTCTCYFSIAILRLIEKCSFEIHGILSYLSPNVGGYALCNPFAYFYIDRGGGEGGKKKKGPQAKDFWLFFSPQTGACMNSKINVTP